MTSRVGATLTLWPFGPLPVILTSGKAPDSNISITSMAHISRGPLGFCYEVVGLHDPLFIGVCVETAVNG